MGGKHVIALSGGKDSTAMALRMRELWPDLDVEYICTPTGDELDDMEAHWTYLEGVLDSPLIRLQNDDRDTLATLIDNFNALPNNRMRWCTRILKIEPCIEYMERNSPAILYVGLRADEPPDMRQGGVYDDIEGVTQRFPMREWGWTIDDVWRYLKEKDVNIPRRTDCARCYHQRLGEWWNLWKDYPDKYQSAIDDEEKTSRFRGKQMTFRNPSRDQWPTSLYDLREAFKEGRTPGGAEVTKDMFGGVGMCRVCSL